MKLPVLFIGHGSPVHAVQDSDYTEEWQNYGDELLDEYDGEIEAVLCISSQWVSEGAYVTSSAAPPMIGLRNLAGFPPALYEYRYPAEGSPDTAERIRELSGGAVRLDPARGFDYGVWSVLGRMFPDADIPVVQLSLDNRLNAQGHFDLAKKLIPLRNEGVLVVGSGNIVCNLAAVDWQNPHKEVKPYPWAELAHELVNKWIIARRYGNLLDEQHYPLAIRQAIGSSPPHFWPLLYVLAMCGEKEPLELFNDVVVGRAVSMTSLVAGFV